MAGDIAKTFLLILKLLDFLVQNNLMNLKTKKNRSINSIEKIFLLLIFVQNSEPFVPYAAFNLDWGNSHPA